MTGDELKRLRKKYGLTQPELAYLMNIGDKAQISRMETGFRKISYAESILLGIIFAHLERGEKPPTPPDD